MNYNIYLENIYTLIKSNSIIEEKKIEKFSGKNIVNQKNIFSKSCKLKEVIVKIQLENKKTLLLKDLPINFFLYYTIFVGENAQMYSFKLKDREEEFISTANIYEILKENIVKNSTQKISVDSLKGQKFSFVKHLSSNLSKLREDISKKDNLNLDCLHIVEGNNLELFIPNVHNEHLRIANNMKLKLTELIFDNFLIGTGINVFDYVTQIKKLNVLKIIEKNYNVEFDKETKNKIYKDIFNEYYIFVSEDLINEKTAILEDKEKIRESFSKITKISISDSTGDVFLPIWKTSRKNKFLEIQNKEEFLNLSGREFRNEYNFLKDIFVQTLSGERGVIENKYLKKEVEEILTSKHDNLILSYENTAELVIKLLLSNNIVKVLKTDKTTQNLTQQLLNEFKKIEKAIIKQAIDENKIPQKPLKEDIFDTFFNSVKNILVLEKTKFKSSNIEKSQLIKTSIKTTQIVIEILKEKFSFNYYGLIQYALILSDILELLMVDSKENRLRDYIKDIKLDFENHKIDEMSVELVKDLIVANKAGKKYKTITVKKGDLSVEKYLKKTNYSKEEPSYIKIEKPNIDKLKKVFPYSYQDIFFQLTETKAKNIMLKGKNIRINDDYFDEFKDYTGYKIVANNNYFLTIVPLSSNKKA